MFKAVTISSSIDRSAFSLLHRREIKLSRNLASSAIRVNLTSSPLQIFAHALLSTSLLRQILFLRRLRIALEPLVLQELSGGDPLARIQHQRLHQQVDAARADGEEHLHPLGPGPQRLDLGGRDVAVEAADARPIVLGGRADGLADQVELLEVGLGGQEGLAQHELREDGAHAPHVDRAAVVARAVQQLRRPVPPRDDLRRHLVVRVLEAGGETEVCELHLAVCRDQQVVRLDVAVQHEVLVAEPHCAAQHAHPRFDVGHAVVHASLSSDQHLQVAERKELQHEVQVLAPRAEHRQEADDVGMP